MVFNDTINVDLNKPLARSRAVLASGDNMANCFGASIYQNGKAVDISGYAVTGYFVKPDGDTLVIAGSASGNTAQVTLPQACYANAGSGSLAIKVIGVKFTGTVRVVDCHTMEVVTDKAYDPGDDVLTLDVIMAHIAAVENNVKTTAAPAIIPTAQGVVVSIPDSAERPLAGLRLYGHTTQNGTPSPAVSIPLVNVGAAGGSISIRACGKNMFDASPDGVQCIGGAYVNEPYYDYAITDNDTCWAYRVFVRGGETYVISTSAPDMLGNVRYEDASQNLVGGMSWSNLKNKSFVVPAQAAYMVLSIEKTLVDQYAYQIEVGSIATAFEGYKDGGSLTASTPGGMAGIPTADGGMLCDYIEYGHGVYVQHVQRIVLDGDEVITYDGDAFNVAGAIQSGGKAYMAGLCSAYPVATNYGEFVAGDFSVCNWSNDALRIRHGGSTDVAGFKAWLAAYPVTLYFPMPTPAYRSISAEEMAAYRAMTTHWPTTTVYNDAGAAMHVDYIADTKTYIDQRIAALLKN